jgi:hypothetical protein
MQKEQKGLGLVDLRSVIASLTNNLAVDVKLCVSVSSTVKWVHRDRSGVASKARKGHRPHHPRFKSSIPLTSYTSLEKLLQVPMFSFLKCTIKMKRIATSFIC